VNPRKRLLACVLAIGTCTMVISSLIARAQTPPPELGQGWIPEFTATSRQLLELAEAIPEEKYAWRPAAGVRSISEVYMHIALGNFWLLEQAGGKSPLDLATLGKTPEKSITGKAQVLDFLRKSFDAVKAQYQSIDRAKPVQFLGQPTTSDKVFLRILVHDNEHMGQSVAYARMIGVVPPWSK